jgi:uncharacterized RDD family membrane protein YckC
MDTATGLYFRTEDYAPLWRRFMIDIIDGLTAGIVCTALTAAFWGFTSVNLILCVWATIFFAYFVILKRSKFGTVGYRLGVVKIVGLNGQVPSVGSLTLRLLFMSLGPMNYLVDVMWLSTDLHRQALRDKFAQTYVVRKAAQPIGKGRVVHRYCHILGYNFLFREIAIQADAPAVK